MNPHAGLSFDQAPLFAVPLRFLLTAPLFLFAAGVLVAGFPETLASRWTNPALAVTHAVTLGFLAMVMQGALMQMLPVVAGATLPAARAVAWISHVALTLGTLALGGGFLLRAEAAFAAAITLLGAGFGVFLLAAAAALIRAARNDTVNGIRLALAGLAVTVILGMVLAWARAGGAVPDDVAGTIAAHAGFGLLGWVLLLVVGVAYQVVPMFQITPTYPSRLSRWLAPGIACLLLLHAASMFLVPGAVDFVEFALAGVVLTFALATLRLQARRRRTLPDVTLDYWRLGMASLAASAALWVTGWLVPALRQADAFPLLLGVLFLVGFAVSVVTGMLYKIVPFLAWFHLQAQLQAKAGTIPTMKQMIAEPAMRRQFRVHAAACALLVAATGWAPLSPLAGGVWALSAVLLGANLLAATRRFAACGGQFA